MNNYYVQIIQHKDEKVIRDLGPFSESKADRVE